MPKAETVVDDSSGDATIAADRLAIRDLLENWVLWRDGGDWDQFATVWHEGGRMNATWFKADATEFISGCRRAFEGGMVGLHSLGGMTIDVKGSRAIAQTRMQIVQRGRIDEIEVDVICQGRFFDAFERRGGRWGIVLRQPVYELDRMVPVTPAAMPRLDADLLAAFPLGYRHLAYLQTQMGFDVSTSLPGTRGPQIDALNSKMQSWLCGADASCLQD